jgi:hypothetical protein
LQYLEFFGPKLYHFLREKIAKNWNIYN